jgi:hypothetical protein
MTAQQKKRTARKVDVRVSYGLGKEMFGRFPREEIAGLSARDLIDRVISGPQEPGSAARTAKVLADVLATQRSIDAELTRASSGDADGEPISLDQVIVTEEGGEEQRESPVVQESDQITIRLSESYVGGGKRWQVDRRVDRE